MLWEDRWQRQGKRKENYKHVKVSLRILAVCHVKTSLFVSLKFGSNIGIEPTVVKLDDIRDRQKSTEGYTIKLLANTGTNSEATLWVKVDTGARGNVLPF